MSEYRDPQGTALDKIKAFANLEITREDQATINCGMFTDLAYACNYVGAWEGVKSNHAYLGLAIVGRDRCYYEYKNDDSKDIFTDLAAMRRLGMLAIGNISLMGVADESLELFHNVHTVKMHTTQQSAKIISDMSEESGVWTSHLYLYHCLKGLEYIANNESHYIDINQEALIEDALRPLKKADRILEGRRDLLRVWMGI